MKVFEFIKWLEDQDQDAIVEVLSAVQGRYEVSVREVEFDPRKHQYYLSEYKGQKTLLLGDD